MTLTLYSQYFNPKSSRRLGRRVSLAAARNFTDGKLEEILKSMNIKYEIRDARYPRIPWEKSKMFIVEANLKKSTLLSLIERKLS